MGNNLNLKEINFNRHISCIWRRRLQSSEGRVMWRDRLDPLEVK